MRHDINQIASNYDLNKDKFKAFALKNENKYGIINENGLITTSTSFCDALVEDFMTERVEAFKKKYDPKNNPKITVDREILNNVLKYCEAQQVYDKLGAYGDFYYKLKSLL